MSVPLVEINFKFFVFQGRVEGMQDLGLHFSLPVNFRGIETGVADQFLAIRRATLAQEIMVSGVTSSFGIR